MLEKLIFAPVPGLLNPGDISTKVLSERRLRALLGAQKVVDTANSMELVGNEEWINLLEQHAVTQQIRRVTRQVNNRCVNSKAFLRVALLSMLVTGSDAHVRQVQVGIQTDEPRFEVSWMTVTAMMCMVVLIVFTGWSLEPMHKDTAVTDENISANITEQACSVPDSVPIASDDTWTWSQNMWKYLNALLVAYTAYVHISMCMMSRCLAKLCERVGTPDDNHADEPDENDDDTAARSNSTGATGRTWAPKSHLGYAYRALLPQPRFHWQTQPTPSAMRGMFGLDGSWM